VKDTTGHEPGACIPAEYDVDPIIISASGEQVLPAREQHGQLTQLGPTLAIISRNCVNIIEIVSIPPMLPVGWNVRRLKEMKKQDACDHSGC